MGKGTGRWVALVGASFLVHSILAVNSTETALWNSQGQQGSLLAQQLADAAAPLALARDMVSLSVLTARYENHPGIASIRLFTPQNERLSEAGQTDDQGRLFSAPMQLQQQALGQVELRLQTPSRGDIVRGSLGNIGLSVLLHLLVLAGGFFMTRSEPAPARGARPLHPENRPTPAAPAPQTDIPAAITPGSHLHIVLDDPNGLLRRVNAAMADEMLSVFDQLIDRAARLYGGEVETPFGVDGVVVHFHTGDNEDRLFCALAAAQLFLQLVNDAGEERRACGRLSLPCKAGVTHGHADATQAEILARTAPTGTILTTVPTAAISLPCRLGTAFRLAVSDDTSLQVAVVEAFAPEYQQLISNQSLHILTPAETA